jgi:hypothetical protein
VTYPSTGDPTDVPTPPALAGLRPAGRPSPRWTGPDLARTRELGVVVGRIHDALNHLDPTLGPPPVTTTPTAHVVQPERTAVHMYLPRDYRLNGVTVCVDRHHALTAVTDRLEEIESLLCEIVAS